MLGKTRKISDILAGTDAVRAGGELYLPRWGAESDTTYETRRRTAPFVNIYRDIAENLADRPFRKPLKVVEKTASKQILDLCADIDGEGNSIHVFAQDAFFAGLNNGVDYWVIDRTHVPVENPTIADEKAHGARPFIYRIPSKDVLAVRTATIKGKEKFVHVRIARIEIKEDGFDEIEVEQVVIFEREKLGKASYGPATWRLMEKQEAPTNPADEWKQIEAGVFGIDDIPMVAFMAGRRKGRSFQFDLPLEDAAHLQIEHYQSESNLKSIKQFCCFPMLAATGITPVAGKNGVAQEVAIGPGAVLYAPPNDDGKAGGWSFIEPEASSLKVIAADVVRLEGQLREIGRQPLTANSGNLTVVTTQFAAAKGNSAVESWANALKDTLEQALGYVALWLRDPSKPEVQINVDLSIDAAGQDFESVLAMRKLGCLSEKTLWAEARRRSILAPNHSAVAEKEEMALENPDPDGEEDIVGSMTPRLVANAN